MRYIPQYRWLFGLIDGAEGSRLITIDRDAQFADGSRGINDVILSTERLIVIDTGAGLYFYIREDLVMDWDLVTRNMKGSR